MKNEIKMDIVHPKEKDLKISKKCANEVNEIMKKYNCHFDPEFIISLSGVSSRVLIKENLK